MPQVGQQEFPYTAQGIAAANEESRRSGKPVRARRAMSYRGIAKKQSSRARNKKKRDVLTPGDKRD